MAYKPLIIIEKQKGTTGEIAAVTRRLSTPTIIQPEYQFDVSDMLGIFIPEVSFNDNYFKWVGGYVEPSIISMNYPYVDGSLNRIKATYIPEVSLNDNYFKWVGGYVEPSIISMNYPYVDGSLAKRDASIIRLFTENDIQDASIIRIDGSINIIFNKNLSQDASIIRIDGSINAIINKNLSQDASIIRIDAVNVAQDISIAFLDSQRYLHHLLDVSIVDPSINEVIQYDKYGLWENRMPVEIGTILYSNQHIDASFALIVNLNSSLTNLNSSLNTIWSEFENVDISLNNERTYVDGSLNNKININIPCDSSDNTIMSFDKTIGYVYGTINSPLSGEITMNLNNALLGVVDLLIHKNNSTNISLPITYKKLYGVYDGSVNNFIYVQYIDSNNQLYTINHI